MQTKFITGLPRALQIASGPVAPRSGSCACDGLAGCADGDCASGGLAGGGVATSGRLGSITGWVTVSLRRGTGVL
jgi:hypothetical protein